MERGDLLWVGLVLKLKFCVLLETVFALEWKALRLPWNGWALPCASAWRYFECLAKYYMVNTSVCNHWSTFFFSDCCCVMVDGSKPLRFIDCCCVMVDGYEPIRFYWFMLRGWMAICHVLLFVVVEWCLDACVFPYDMACVIRCACVRWHWRWNSLIDNPAFDLK